MDLEEGEDYLTRNDAKNLMELSGDDLNRKIRKLYIDTVGLSCYTRIIEQPIAQKRSPEIKYI